MIKIPEQKQVVFVGSPYEISVEKVSKNTYRYHLINEDVPIVGTLKRMSLSILIAHLNLSKTVSNKYTV